MKNLFLALSLIISTLFFSCEKGNMNGYETHYSNGNVITSEVTVDFFTGIIVESKCDVIIKTGTEQKVSISISDNILNDVNLAVVNGIWTIDFKKDMIATLNDHEFTVVIESSDLTFLEMQSSGSVVCEDPITTSEFNLIHDSSGSVLFDCEVETLMTKMDGSGILDITGSATQHDLTHLSSGNTFAYSLITSNTALRHDGSGDAQIYVTADLSGIMDGSGDVFYKGNPSIAVLVDGSGELINAN